MRHTPVDEGEDAGTAGVRSRHSVAAGVCVRLCVSPDLSHYRRQENEELQPQSHSEIKWKYSQHLK